MILKRRNRGSGARLAAAALILLAAVTIRAAAADLPSLVKDVFKIPAVTGNEERLAAHLRGALPASLSAEIDSIGSVYARSGKETSGFAVLAALDEFGWFVSAITPDGFLRLDRAAAAPLPLYDSFLMGHAVSISTRSGPQTGIVVQPALHVMTRERREEIARGVTLDLIYVDVGARSEAEVKARGIEYMDGVSLRADLAGLAGGQLAGPSLGQKSACAALLAAALEIATAKSTGGADFVWAAQTRFAARGRGGLGAVRAKNRLQPKTVLILDVVSAEGGEKGPAIGKGPVVWQAKDVPSKLKAAIEAAAGQKKIALQAGAPGQSALLVPFLAEGIDAVVLAVPVKFARTPSESVSLADVEGIRDIVAALAGKGVQP